MNLKLSILCDSREQAPFAFSGYPVEVSVGGLEAGDYSVRGFERRVAVERKTLGDLVGCLGADRQRFERELARLRGYDCAAVVVESPTLALRQGRYLRAAGCRGRVAVGAGLFHALPDAVDLLRGSCGCRGRDLRSPAPLCAGSMAGATGVGCRKSKG